jgi:hypothetical protein
MGQKVTHEQQVAILQKVLKQLRETTRFRGQKELIRDVEGQLALLMAVPPSASRRTH